MTVAAKNVLRQIRIILYRLKRNFGIPGTLKRRRTMSNNVKTGDIVVDYEEILIKKMIFLPRRNISDFVYDLSYIAASKNFTYGGYFDTNDRWIIIDIRDLPTSYREPNKTQEITTDFHIVFETRRYNIYEVNLAEHNQGYLLRAREIVGSDAE
jgi:hypothetical protein